MDRPNSDDRGTTNPLTPGRFFELVFRTVGKSKLEKAFVNSVKAIEARNYEPTNGDSRTSTATSAG